jgi:UDP-N-acetylmuramyl tripeptide synthase
VTGRRAGAPSLERARATLAAGAVVAVNRTSRRLGRGSGTVVGGRVGLALAPRLLGELGRARRVALVTGTNGKTTTTRLLSVAVAGAGGVATNDTGANMPAGHLAALVASPGTAIAVLEVDEVYLGALADAVWPRVVVLLNLSRDQLDRTNEVRMLAERWRTSLGRVPVGAPAPHVVANADDPLVVWAAQGAAGPCVWVGAGQVWRLDAVGCPACGGRIRFGPGTAWACDSCSLARPTCAAWLEDGSLARADGSRLPVRLAIPGRFNQANAVMAAMAAPLLTAGPAGGRATTPVVTVEEALVRMAGVDDVAGRFAVLERRGAGVRLALAKNPAGWTAVFDLLEEERGVPERPSEGACHLVLSVNARVADGADTSWLWDVPFERLAGLPAVVATGERHRDLAVRLRYAGVDHVTVADPLEAVDVALERRGTLHDLDAPARPERPTGPGGAAVTVVANYTAFSALRRRW